MNKIELYTEMLVAGFRNDPGIKFQVSVCDKADSIVKAQCKGEIEAFHNLGLIRTVNDDGILAAFSPEQAQTAEFTEAMAAAAKYVMQAATEQELMDIQSRVSVLAEISRPDWYVKFLGNSPVSIIQIIVIKPEMRGRGVFRKLITPLIEQCESENRSMVLQTHNPANIPIYEHFGFELMESVSSEKIDITCYNMMRKARRVLCLQASNAGAGR